jgi:hypothetical protein
MFKTPIRLFIIFVVLAGCLATCAYMEDVSNESYYVLGETEIIPSLPAIERIRIGTNLWVIMDHTTGCQLIETDVGVAPRMNANGTQYCIDNLEEPINE